MTDQDVMRVAAEAQVDPRTVRKALEGQTRSFATREAIAKAAERLGHKREAKRIRSGKERRKRCK